MAKIYEVLEMLIPQGGWLTTGDSFDDIQFIDCQPITKKQLTDGFAKYDFWKAEQDAARVAAKQSAQAKLAALGLTVEDLQALGL
jgi:hypothetical protein